MAEGPDDLGGLPERVGAYRLHAVPSALRPYVRAIWTLDGTGEPLSERVPATLAHDLVLGETPYGCVIDGVATRSVGAVLHGLTASARRYDHAGEDRLTGVQFEPGGLGAFCADVRTFADQADRCFASTVWGDPSPVVRAGAVVERLLGLLEPDPDTDALVRALLAAPRVDVAADRLGTTSRTLRRHALRRVGLSPKHIQRIGRFDRARTLRDRGRDLAEVAVLAGFADQAHLCREWRALAGVSPTGR